MLTKQLTIATVIKLISEVLPDEILCARETKELILECCMGVWFLKRAVILILLLEFVHLIASECNDICNKTTKKTINADHVLQSLKNLGFEGYLDEVKEAYDEHKKDQKVCAVSRPPTLPPLLRRNGIHGVQTLRNSVIVA